MIPNWNETYNEEDDDDVNDYRKSWKILNKSNPLQISARASSCDLVEGGMCLGKQKNVSTPKLDPHRPWFLGWAEKEK